MDLFIILIDFYFQTRLVLPDFKINFHKNCNIACEVRQTSLDGDTVKVNKTFCTTSSFRTELSSGEELCELQEGKYLALCLFSVELIFN